MFFDRDKKQRDEDLAKIERAQRKMEKSIREGKKYFVDPEVRVFTSKGWGWMDDIANIGRKIFVKMGRKTDWHYHTTKTEILYVDSGRLLVIFSEDDTLDDACEIVLKAGHVFEIYPRLRHRLKGLEDCHLTEFGVIRPEPDEFCLEKGD
jgi:mannose-6-phosphate isomerase-like protein (cupin superfamily)